MGCGKIDPAMEPAGKEQRVGVILAERGMTLCVAESCTGGLLADRLTDVPGSSRYFQWGVISYSNAAKTALLGVPREVLASFGAVSDPVARAMAAGVRQRGGVDLGVSTTGIAGPTGATSEKPVGLVYVALSYEDGCCCQRHLFRGTRREVKRWTAEAALSLIAAYLEGGLNGTDSR